MSILHDKFTNIKDLNDLQSLVSETEDGESTTIEFKSITEKLKKSNLGEPKALLAKEICAFLNSNDGILVWGAEKSEDGKVAIVNRSEMNLEDNFDRQLKNLVEPLPSGIEFKTIKDDDVNECLVIFIPRSDLAPHRVGDWKMNDEKRILGRYYGRSGTSSVSLPENIVRAMYLSRGRIPNVSIYTEVNVIDAKKVRLKTVVKPDSQRYISQYYNSNQIAIIDSDFRVMPDEDGNLWREVHDMAPDSQHNPIYPKQEPYELLSSMVLDDEEDEREETTSDNANSPWLPTVSTIIPKLPHMDGDLHLTPVQFSRIFAIATKSNFSCDSVPLITKTRLYILDTPQYWTMNGYGVTQTEVLAPLEQQFATEIYIATTFQNYLCDDGDAQVIATDGRLHTSYIKRLLEKLLRYPHD